MSATRDNTIRSFVDHLKFEKRYSAHTIRSYEDDLRAFYDYLVMEFSGMAWKDITPAVVRSWLASMRDAGLSPRSINRKISSLRSYYKFLLKGGQVEASPMNAVLSPKMKKRLPVFVEQKDMAILLEGIRFPDDWEGWTDRLIMAILYHTGMRLSELIGLRGRQVEHSNREIKVLGQWHRGEKKL